MTYGGGNWTEQDKVLPGVYINVTTKDTSAVEPSTRGICAMAMSMSWGEDSKIGEISAKDFAANAKKVFGYAYSDDKLKPVREIFRKANKLYFYKLNGNCVKAECTYGTAKYGGLRGNDLELLIQTNVDVTSTFDVTTFLAGELVDKQMGVTATTILDNAWIVFKDTAFVASANKVALVGGTDGNTATAANHTAFLNAISAYDVNIVINSVDTIGSDNVNLLYTNWIKSQREDMGNKLQVVVYNYNADYEGVVNVYNSLEAVYWVGGALSACELSASIQGTEYDGEYTILGDYTPAQLIAASDAGRLCLQNDNWKLRVLDDINSLTTFTPEKDEEFKYNQTVRVLDSIANEVKDIFVANYLGRIVNNDNGRASFKSDIISLLTKLRNSTALASYDKSKLSVVQGDTIRNVVVRCAVTPSNCMSQVYMTVVVE